MTVSFFSIFHLHLLFLNTFFSLSLIGSLLIAMATTLLEIQPRNFRIGTFVSFQGCFDFEINYGSLYCPFKVSEYLFLLKSKNTVFWYKTIEKLPLYRKKTWSLLKSKNKKLRHKKKNKNKNESENKNKNKNENENKNKNQNEKKTTTTKMKTKTKMKIKTNFHFCFHFDFNFRFCFWFGFLKVFAFLLILRGLEVP